MSLREPQLDLAKIVFPTDRLSIKDLRFLFPNDFDAPNDRVRFFGVTGQGADLAAVLQLERDIAKWAFEVAVGRATSDWVNGYEQDPRDAVAEALIEYGLATGPHHAKQQVRDIEVQAAAQAKGVKPPVPPRT